MKRFASGARAPGGAGARWWLGAAALCGALLAPASALAADSSGLVVTPQPAAGPARSYFKLSLARGQIAEAGTIVLRNPSAGTVRVQLAPVVGQTINTLGSTYATPGRRISGAARWLRLGARRVTLTGGQSIAVPISLSVPRSTRPGDYLAGVSVEAANQQRQTVTRGRASIASVVRYAIGVEATIGGPRHAAIELTGARLEREPGGLSFLLLARNSGNVILQGVIGAARVTRGGRTVLQRTLGPGTFVAGTSIAYPLPVLREAPRQGTCYRVAAWLRYRGGVAHLHAPACFGHRQAVIQHEYGGPPASGSGGGGWWKIALLAGAILYGIATTTMLLRRRRARGGPPANPAGVGDPRRGTRPV